ncbi:MAG TPA: hypothetical protein PLN56_03995 [Methanoregulaceae archaeon]|nr:MAG: hypothetical protein IPI71_08300 [Methanolinea sp.]HON81251.1 hypothetical protein [Methanoregulaceae archaeon]HPD10143.1 hypothetical protein [Methanoregulaceae archaeon]HRT15149.1 hypothetical protein [Methanoregulaceae archaeon]HRU30734.1 hypothetical protein [Methanoregulaceae archaeon]
MMKHGIITMLVAGLLVAVSCAGFVDEPIEMNNPNWTGFSRSFMEKLSPFGEFKIYNLYDEFYPPPKITTPENETPTWKPIKIVPEPLPITKKELFQSMITISPQKQSLLQSLSGRPMY